MSKTIQNSTLKKEKLEWNRSASKAGISPEIRDRVSKRFDERMKETPNPRVPKLKGMK